MSFTDTPQTHFQSPLHLQLYIHTRIVASFQGICIHGDTQPNVQHPYLIPYTKNQAYKLITLARLHWS